MDGGEGIEHALEHIELGGESPSTMVSVGSTELSTCVGGRKKQFNLPSGWDSTDLPQTEGQARMGHVDRFLYDG